MHIVKFFTGFRTTECEGGGHVSPHDCFAQRSGRLSNREIDNMSTDACIKCGAATERGRLA